MATGANAAAPSMFYRARCSDRKCSAQVAKEEQFERLTSAFDLMRHRARDASSAYLTIQIEALQARRLYLLGRRNAAHSIMRQLLQRVETTGYVRMVIDLPGLYPLLQLADNAYANRLLAQRLPASPAPAASFTRRGREILALLAEGLSLQQIAGPLVLASSTMRTYLSRLCAKLGVENHTQAVAWSRRYRQP